MRKSAYTTKRTSSVTRPFDNNEMRNGTVQQNGGQDKMREKRKAPHVPCNTRQEAAFSQYALHVNELDY